MLRKNVLSENHKKLLLKATAAHYHTPKETQDEGYKKAYELYSVIISEAPDYSPTYLQRAHVLQALGSMQKDSSKYFDEAIADCNQYLELNSKPDNEVYILRAQLYHQKGDNKQALSNLKVLLSNNDPSNYYAYFERSRIYTEMGMHEEALNDSIKALENLCLFYKDKEIPIDQYKMMVKQVLYNFIYFIKNTQSDISAYADLLKQYCMINLTYSNEENIIAACAVALKKSDNKEVHDVVSTILTNVVECNSQNGIFNKEKILELISRLPPEEELQILHLIINKQTVLGEKMWIPRPTNDVKSTLASIESFFINCSLEKGTLKKAKERHDFLLKEMQDYANAVTTIAQGMGPLNPKEDTNKRSSLFSTLPREINDFILFKAAPSSLPIATTEEIKRKKLEKYEELKGKPPASRQ